MEVRAKNVFSLIVSGRDASILTDLKEALVIGCPRC